MPKNIKEKLVSASLKPLGEIIVDGQPLFSEKNLADVASVMVDPNQEPFRPLTMDDLDNLK